MSKDFAFWTETELSIIRVWKDKTIDFIQEMLQNAGFVRSKESIAKKRRVILKEKVGYTDLGGTQIYTGSIDVSKIYSSGSLPAKITKDQIYSSKLPDKITVGYLHIPKPKHTRTLVVPDAHTAPDQDLSRFTALGKHCNTTRPNNIVFMGDFANMDSLSRWDEGKESSHGKKYKEDIRAAKQALELFLDEIGEDYKPNLYFLGGNHDEGRIDAYIETHHQLRGHMDFAEDLDLEYLGFKYVPYKEYLEIEGVLFTHAVMNAANKPVSGKNVMNLISTLTAKSIVVGHHHRFETMSYFRHGADDVQQVLLCGLFSEHTDPYADGAANSYSRCIVELTHYKYGRFDINQTCIDRLKAEYL